MLTYKTTLILTIPFLGISAGGVCRIVMSNRDVWRLFCARSDRRPCHNPKNPHNEPQATLCSEPQAARPPPHERSSARSHSPLEARALGTGVPAIGQLRVLHPSSTSKAMCKTHRLLALGPSHPAPANQLAHSTTSWQLIFPTATRRAFASCHPKRSTL